MQGSLEQFCYLLFFSFLPFFCYCIERSINSEPECFECMSLPLENIKFPYLLNFESFCFNTLSNLFGNSLNWDQIGNNKISRMENNFWIWNHISCQASVASTVYDSAVSLIPHQNIWKGWSIIWKLPVLPRIKVFIWKLALGRLPTSAYMYHLNIGPNSNCPFCGLVPEDGEHLIWKCRMISHCWFTVLDLLGWNHSVFSILSTGSWLLEPAPSKIDKLRPQAFIATVAWIIWKSRCNLIFKNSQVNFNLVVSRAWSIFQDFNRTSLRDSLIPQCYNNFITIFTDASWDANSASAGLGFIIVINMNRILLAGAKGTTTKSPFEAEIAAINLAFQTCAEHRWDPSRLCCDCPGIIQLLKNYNACVAWHVEDEYHKLKRHLSVFPNTNLENISRDVNEIADALATFGRLNPQLTRFFQGLDRPSWLENLCASFNFVF